MQCPRRWVAHNDELACQMGWPENWHSQPTKQRIGGEVWSGNALWPGMLPMASVYSGHQFGVWAGQLGDGGRCCWVKCKPTLAPWNCN